MRDLMMESTLLRLGFLEKLERTRQWRFMSSFDGTEEEPCIVDNTVMANKCE